MLVMVVFFIAFRWIHLSTPLIRLFLLVLILLLMPTLNFLPVWFALSLLRFRLRLKANQRSEERFSRNAETEIYTLSLHDALPIFVSVGADIAFDADPKFFACLVRFESSSVPTKTQSEPKIGRAVQQECRDRDLHSFPTRRSSDLCFCWC